MAVEASVQQPASYLGGILFKACRPHLRDQNSVCKVPSNSEPMITTTFPPFLLVYSVTFKKAKFTRDSQGCYGESNLNIPHEKGNCPDWLWRKLQPLETLPPIVLIKRSSPQAHRVPIGRESR